MSDANGYGDALPDDVWLTDAEHTSSAAESAVDVDGAGNPRSAWPGPAVLPSDNWIDEPNPSVGAREYHGHRRFASDSSRRRLVLAVVIVGLAFAAAWSLHSGWWPGGATNSDATRTQNSPGGQPGPDASESLIGPTSSGQVATAGVASSTVQPDGFTIAVTPSSGTVSAGGFVTATVRITLTSGAAQAVDLSASGLPASITARFAPTSIGSGVSVLTLRTTPTTPAGTYVIALAGTGTSATDTVRFTLTVTGKTPCRGNCDD